MSGKKSLIEAYLKNLDKKVTAQKAGQNRIGEAAAIQGKGVRMADIPVYRPTIAATPVVSDGKPLELPKVKKSSKDVEPARTDGPADNSAADIIAKAFAEQEAYAATQKPLSKKEQRQADQRERKKERGEKAEMRETRKEAIADAKAVRDAERNAAGLAYATAADPNEALPAYKAALAAANAKFEAAKKAAWEPENQKIAPERYDPFVQYAGMVEAELYDPAVLAEGVKAKGNPLNDTGKIVTGSGGMAQASEAMGKKQAIAALTEDQKAYINYVYGKYDKKLAGQLSDALLENVLIELRAGSAGQKADNVFAAFGGSIAAAPVYAAEMLGQTAENIAKGVNLPVADYTPGSRAMARVNAGTQDLVDDAETPVGQFLVGTGISVGQNALNTALFGAAAPYVMGVQAAASSGYDAAQNGATGFQQLGKALQGGATEFVTEGISWGKLDDILKNPGTKNFKQAIAQVGAQFATEAGEEAAGEAINIIYDWMLMGDAGDLKQHMDAYKAEHGGDGYAAELALEILRRVGGAALEGAISGAALGGGATLLSLGNAATPTEMPLEAVQSEAVSDVGESAKPASALRPVEDFAVKAAEIAKQHEENPSVKKERLEPQQITATTEKMDTAIRDLTGEDGKSVNVVLTQNAVERMLDKGLTASDIADAVAVLEDFDEAYLSTETSAKFRDKNGGSAKQISFVKNVGDGAVVVNVALDTRNGQYAVADIALDDKGLSTIKAWDGNIDMQPVEKAQESAKVAPKKVPKDAKAAAKGVLPAVKAGDIGNAAANVDPQSVGAKVAAFKYREAQTQTNSMNEQDKLLNMTDEEKAKYGAKPQKHQVISWAQQEENAKQLVQQRNKTNKRYGVDKSYKELTEATAWDSEQVATAYALRDELLNLVRNGTDAEKKMANERLMELSDQIVEHGSEVGRALGYMASFKYRNKDHVLNTIVKEYRKLQQETMSKGKDKKHWEKVAADVAAKVEELREAARTAGKAANVDKTIRSIAKRKGIKLTDEAVANITKAFWEGANADTIAAMLAKEYAAQSGLDVDIDNMTGQIEELRAAAKKAGKAVDIDKTVRKMLEKRKIELPEDDIQSIVRMFWDGADSDELEDAIVFAYGKTIGLDVKTERLALEDAVKQARKDISAAGEIIKVLDKYDIKVSKAARTKLDKLFWAGDISNAFYDVIADDATHGKLTPDDLGKIADLLDQADLLAEEKGHDSKEVIDLQNQAFAIAAEKMGHSGSWVDTFKYAAMLTNAKTNENNVISMFVNAAHNQFADWLSRGVETALAKKGKLQTASKAKNVPAELKGACYADAQRNYGKLTGDSIVSAKQGIEKQRRRVAKNGLQKAIIKLSDISSAPMAEADQKGLHGVLAGFAEMSPRLKQFYDALDKKVADRRLEGKLGLCGLDNTYANALSQYLAANGEDKSIFKFEKEMDAKRKAGEKPTDAEKARLELLTNARNHSVEAAKEVTFHTYNETASYLNDAAKGKAGKVVQTVVKGTLPYIATPVNITKNALRYSPIGIAETVTAGRADLAEGKITQAQFIKRVAQNATGTGEVILGVALGFLGIITGYIGNDREDKYRKDLGEQAYAINLGKLGTYTIDNMLAANPGVLIGASIANLIQEMGKGDGGTAEDLFNIAVEVALGAFQPVADLTMLEGLNSAIGNATDVPSFVANAIVSTGKQFVPTLFGQLARALSGTRKSTYVSASGAAKTVARTAKAIELRLPLIANGAEDYIDVWGNTQSNYGLLYQLFSPGYYGKNVETATDKELLRLYAATDDSKVLPATPYTAAVKLGGKERKLTQEEYVKLSKESGKADYELTKAFLGTDLYNELPDDMRAVVVSALHTLSDKYGYFKLDAGYELESTDKLRIECYEEYGAEMTSLLIATQKLKDEEGHSLDNRERLDFIDGLDVTKEQKAVLYALDGGTAKDIYDQSKKAAEMWYALGMNTDSNKDGSPSKKESLPYLSKLNGSAQDKGYVLAALDSGEKTDTTQVIKRLGEDALASWYTYYSTLYNEGEKYRKANGYESVSTGTRRQEDLMIATLDGMSIDTEWKALYWDLVANDSMKEKNPYK